MLFIDSATHLARDEFPEDVPIAHAAVHIGLLLRWCFARGWVGDRHAPNDADAIVAGERSAAQYVLDQCGGALSRFRSSDDAKRARGEPDAPPVVPWRRTGFGLVAIAAFALLRGFQNCDASEPRLTNHRNPVIAECAALCERASNAGELADGQTARDCTNECVQGR